MKKQHKCDWCKKPIESYDDLHLFSPLIMKGHEFELYRLHTAGECARKFADDYRENNYGNNKAK